MNTTQTNLPKFHFVDVHKYGIKHDELFMDTFRPTEENTTPENKEIE